MGGKARTRVMLSDAWRRWVAAASAGGVSPDLIVEELVTEGVPRALATYEVNAIVQAIAPIANQLARHTMAAKMRGTLRGEIHRRSLCDREAFRRLYLETSTPVLFQDGCAPLNIVDSWTPRSIVARAGNIEVAVSQDRELNREHLLFPERHVDTMPLVELVEYLEAGASNDVYLVARNRALEGPLAFLLQDLRDFPAFLDTSNLKGALCMWMGPMGTHTPMHHDTSHILFCQIFGRKVVRLVAPDDPALLAGEVHETFYATAPKGTRVFELTIEPGQALYIPLGWWHEVRALDASISLSFTGFLDGKHDDTYRMGAPPISSI